MNHKIRLMHIISLSLSCWITLHSIRDDCEAFLQQATYPPIRIDQQQQRRRRRRTYTENHYNSSPISSHFSVSLEKGGALDSRRISSSDNTSSNSYKWLEHATASALDLTYIPVGRLTSDDILSISGLMAAWAKRKSDHAAMKVEALLKRIVDDNNSGNTSVKVTTRMYTMAIDAWAKASCGVKAAERACEIHNNMERMYQKTRDENIRPTTISYNAVINSWSKCADKIAPYKAEEILQHMLSEWRIQGNENVKPDVVSFTSCIDAWAKSGEPKCYERALELFSLMERLYKDENEYTMKPNVYTYSACINAFAKSSDHDAPIRAEALLHHMKACAKAGDTELQPNVVNFNACINAWGRCKLPGSAQKAENILRLMQSDGIQPDILSYSLVVSAWCHSSDHAATKKAERILWEMEDWVKAGMKSTSWNSDGTAENSNLAQRKYSPLNHKEKQAELDVECYNAVLITLSRLQESDAVERSLSIISRMKQLVSLGYTSVKPNAKSWNAVLNTISRSNKSNVVQLSEEVFLKMQQDVKPDVYSFAALLHAYQKTNDHGAAQRADDIVRTMEQLYFNGDIASPPDVYHYTIVCACWARSGNRIAARRCSQILQHMEDRYKAGQSNCKPNVRTYNAVIDAHARGKNVEEAEALLDLMIARYKAGDSRMKPDSFTFNACINAYTRSPRRGSGEKAENVLKKLLDFHSKYPDLQPDTRSFSHLIDYYSRCPEPNAAERAERTLQMMIELYKSGINGVLPNIFCFTGVISAYTVHNSADAGRCAERICRLAVDLYVETKAGKLKPNTFLMNAVIHALLKSLDPGAGERAESILLEMEKKYSDGNFDMQTNTRTYGLVLATWSKSKSSEKAIKARGVLQLMQEKSLTNENVCVNIHCFNAVINAAAFSEGNHEERTRAFHVATETMNSLLQSDITPISASFGTYLKACGKLDLPPSLVEPCIEKAFRECQNLGLVNNFVLTQIRYSSSPELYQRLVGELLHVTDNTKEALRITDIPESWKRNVDDTSKVVQNPEWWQSDDDV